MSMDDPTEMMRVLQQKMDEMQQRHEEEMAAVKADCEARIAREIGQMDGGERVKDKGKGVEGERPPPDTEGDRTWRPSGSEAEESKAKSVHAESAAEDGRMNNSRLGWATPRKDRPPYQTPSWRVFQREQLSAWLGDTAKGSSALPKSKLASVPTRNNYQFDGATPRKDRPPYKTRIKNEAKN
ncbi:uncharacterized protein HKW66_Vig0235090 [Vigna angularis]|uniref:Uncharacterized protein n=1 Tax=Phaseolus angularis TaxID=3914 RepID=A0A8T0KVP9_PHAAN|nr:uncharacterized protein HKW66_Vig0235090 [Vigna angularis]